MINIRQLGILCFLLFAQEALCNSNQNLPEIGDTSSGIVSLEEERRLGKFFLLSLRNQLDMVNDPVISDYLEHLIYKLAVHSQLKDRRLDVLLIDKKELNAFAAPGGIVGINLGLFLNAETEQEFCAILAHELAHLSQRHYARQFDAASKANVSSLAGFLAGILLMSTVGSDAGMAAMSLGQAAAQNQMLSYSRDRESEADRIGIDNLVNAGMDPRAMAYMFEKLNKMHRYEGNKIPEFLRTHPITENRVADSYNQAHQYPATIYPSNLDYQLMRAFALVREEGSALQAEERMRSRLKNSDPVLETASKYGLALALIQQKRFDSAMELINALREAYPAKIAFIVLEARTLMNMDKHQKAVDILKEALLTSPGNYPLSMQYALALISAGKMSEAERQLKKLSQDRPSDPQIWYELAEVYGLANNVVGVHQARAEYFVLMGALDQAIKQLGYALPLVSDNFHLHATISQRQADINKMREEMRNEK